MQADAELDVGQSRADAGFGHILCRKAQFGTGLKNKALGEAHVVIVFEPRAYIALVGQEQRAFDLEEAGREPFDPDGRIGAPGPFSRS